MIFTGACRCNKISMTKPEPIKDPKIKEAHPPKQDWQTLAQEHLAGWQRERADFENYRKDVARREAQLVGLATRALVADLVPVLRDYDLALSHAPRNLSVEAAAWLKGALAVGNALNKVLADHGVSEILPQVGDPVDFKKHESVMVEQAEGVATGQITKVLAKGYALGELVVAPARVAVAK